jgi:hypothetical protein
MRLLLVIHTGLCLLSPNSNIPWLTLLCYASYWLRKKKNIWTHSSLLWKMSALYFWTFFKYLNMRDHFDICAQVETRKSTYEVAFCSTLRCFCLSKEILNIYIQLFFSKTLLVLFLVSMVTSTWHPLMKHQKNFSYQREVGRGIFTDIVKV